MLKRKQKSCAHNGYSVHLETWAFKPSSGLTLAPDETKSQRDHEGAV